MNEKQNVVKVIQSENKSVKEILKEISELNLQGYSLTSYMDINNDGNIEQIFLEKTNFLSLKKNICLIF